MPTATSAAHILLVEDDPIVREIVGTALRRQGHEVDEAATCDAAVLRFLTRAADLVIVDIRLPDGSGHELVDRLRGRGDPAVIFLTSLGGTDDRLRGLSQGDDYIVKAIDLRELLARVEAVLRRYRRARSASSVLDFGGWTVDLVRRELADLHGMVVRLTRAEFDLFAALAQAHGHTLSRDYLLEVVASAETETGPRSVDVLVSRIRRKLRDVAGAPGIGTTPGQGYWFSPP